MWHVFVNMHAVLTRYCAGAGVVKAAVDPEI